MSDLTGQGAEYPLKQKSRNLMVNEKKEMVNKTQTRASLHSKTAVFASMFAGMMDECDEATGYGACLPFLRRNAHSGATPCADSLRRVRLRSDTPQHYAHFLVAGMVLSLL